MKTVEEQAKEAYEALDAVRQEIFNGDPHPTITEEMFVDAIDRIVQLEKRDFMVFQSTMKRWLRDQS